MRTALCCMLLVVARASIVSAEETPWVAVKPDDGAFAAEFPAKPKPHLQNSEGGKIEGFVWESADRKSGLFLLFNAYVAKSPRAFLEGVVAGDTLKGKTSEPNYFEHQGRSSVDYRCTTAAADGSTNHWRKRIIVDAQRVYILQSLAFGKSADDAAVDRFFASFKLAKPASAKTEPVLIGKQQAFRYAPLGLTLPLPQGWYLAEAIAGDYRPQLAKAPVKEDHKLSILIANSKQQFSPRETCSLGVKLMVLAKKPRTIDAYQSEALAALSGGQFEVKIIRQPTVVQVKDREFSRADISLTLGNIAVYQRQYDSFDGEHVLNFALVAPTVEELDTLDDLLSRAQFVEPIDEAAP